MGYVVILLIVYFFMIRDLSSYHEKLIFKKYIIIKNKFLAKILIAKKVDEEKVMLEDQNKCLYVGVISYFMWFILLIGSIIMLKFMKVIPIDNTFINSVNMRTIISLIYIFGLILISLTLINRFKINENKTYKILSIFISCFVVCSIIVNVLIAFGAY